MIVVAPSLLNVVVVAAGVGSLQDYCSCSSSPEQNQSYLVSFLISWKINHVHSIRRL